ncbi:hypothetical protein HZA56_06105 [Candidatus Poribacteria bacterium]|nr:hypothetical protein [Candidatus Poribacteria bacterium]
MLDAIRESNENSNVGGAFNSNFAGLHALRLGDDYSAGGQGEMQYKVILSFDTSTLPDAATIQSAKLMLAASGLCGMNPFTTHGMCYVDIATGFFGAGPRIQKTDFQAAATAERVAVMGAPPIAGDIISQGSLDGSGLAAIDKTGSTQLRVYFATDDNDNDADDWIGFYSGEAVNPLLRPMLCVTYTE